MERSVRLVGSARSPVGGHGKSWCHRSVLVLWLGLLTISCNEPGPKPGNIYENLLTRDRFQVSRVVSCDSLLREQDRRNRHQMKLQQAELRSRAQEDSVFRAKKAEQLAKIRSRIGSVNRLMATLPETDPLMTDEERWPILKRELGLKREREALQKRLLQLRDASVSREPVSVMWPLTFISGLDSTTLGSNCVLYGEEGRAHALTFEDLNDHHTLIKAHEP